MQRTTVVLGAGVAGLTTATRLRELLPDDHQVIVVDRAPEAVQGLSLLWVMRGWRSYGEVRVRPGLPKEVDLLQAEVRSIDLDARQVLTDQGELRYDALVLALGAGLNMGRLPGLEEAIRLGVAGEFYTADGATRLREQLQAVDEGDLVVLIAGIPFKCPAAPYEGAFLIADLLRERAVRDRVRLDVYTPETLPMPVAGPAVGEALTTMLDEQGIGFHPERPVDRIEPRARELVFQNGDRVPFDLLVVIPPHEAPAPVARTGLGPAGWVPAEPRSLRTEADGVWALGDVSLITLPNGKPLPKAAVFAKGEAEAVATGVARYLGVEAPETPFDGTGYCYVEVGGHKAAKGEGQFLEAPAPAVRLHEPSVEYHREKEREEREWIERWRG